MLTTYARTFMIATMTDAREQPRESRARPRDRRNWLGVAWRRFFAARRLKAELGRA
jgi:hypothetical protein